MVALIMSDAHGVSLYAATTQGLKRATHKFRDHLSFYEHPKKAFARFWHQDSGKPYVEHDKPSTELTTTEVADTPFDLSRLDLIVLDPSHFEPVDHCKDPEITASHWRVLDERIEVAMHRRSMTSQKLPLRNFALEYIPELTSHSDSTLDNRQKRGLNRLNRILGFQLAHTLGHTPNAALIDGGDDEQSCWKFAGSTGYLGIRLQARISIESFTIEHLHRNSLPGLDVLQAPRKVILWGLIEGPIDPSKENLYREYMDSEPVSKIVSQSSFILPSESDAGERLILLAAFEYKLSGTPGSQIQTKRTPHSLLSLQLDFQVVILEIISNWNAPSTCLYRVQVHGSPLNAIALPSYATGVDGRSEVSSR